MGIPTMVLGESGTGKTTSLRNFNPADVVLIQPVRKPLPFRNQWKKWDSKDKVGSIVHTDSSDTITRAIQDFPAKYGKKVIIVDDFQYVMANEFMRRSGETGFTKFTEIAKHAWEAILSAQNAPDDVRVYFLSHVQTDDYGQTKAKTIGKLLDEKITLEGLFTIVLRTQKGDGAEAYSFRTRNSGSDTVKTPIGLFDSELISNDLHAVDAAIQDYYQLGAQL